MLGAGIIIATALTLNAEFLNFEVREKRYFSERPNKLRLKSVL